MRVELKTHRYRLSKFEEERFDLAIDHLERLCDTYEMRHLHVTADRAGQSEECQVRMVLSLARRRLVATAQEPGFAPAVQKCVNILSKKIRLAKERVHKGHGEREIQRAKAEAALPNMPKIQEAVRAGDFEAFRDALAEVPEAVEAEIGRRLKYHPDAEALLDDEFIIADLVEAVLHEAFESFGARPDAVPLRDWLVGLVDPAIESLTTGARTTGSGEEIKNAVAPEASRHTSAVEPPASAGNIERRGQRAA